MLVTIIREGEVQLIGDTLVGCVKARDGRAFLARLSLQRETEDDLRRYVARERRQSEGQKRAGKPDC